ncbi:unnamed protein product [Sympodiomycopsis kandeliae]
MSLDQAFNWTRAPPGAPLATISGSDRAVVDSATQGTGSEEATLSTPPPPPSGSTGSGNNMAYSPATAAILSKSPNLDCYVEGGPPRRPSASDDPPASSTSASAAPQRLTSEAWSSLKSVFNIGYQSADPKRAAKTLVALLAGSPSQATSSRFRTRLMSASDRSQIITSLRESPTGFQGAVLDEKDGRRMLAAWLRDTIDDSDVWGATRLPLLRLLFNAPVMRDHIVDSATNTALGKAIGFVQKYAPSKSKDLATNVRQKWESIARGEASNVDSPAPSSSNGSSAAKRLAVEDDGPREAKKGKTTPQPSGAGSSSIRPTNSDSMQSLSSLSTSSAYLASVGKLASGSTQGSRLPVSGSDRASDLKGLAKKTVTRTDGTSKQTCPKCQTPLIDGITSTSRVRPSAAATRSVVQVCNKCQTPAKKTPAPPKRTVKSTGRLALEDDNDNSSASETSARPSSSKPLARRPANSNDMFSSLLSKPDAKKSAGASAAVKADTKASTPPGGPIKKPKKKVQWRDSNLVEVKLIESVFDADEETHAEIESRGLHGLEMDEGIALRAAQAVDSFEEEVEWYTPPEVERPDPPAAERGSQSEQAKTEEARENSTLSAVYLDSSEIPATPLDAQNVEPVDTESEPQAIPAPPSWIEESVAGGNVQLSELMKKISSSFGGNISREDAAAVANSQTSLEALGISSDGLQQLLGNVSGGGESANSMPYVQYPSQTQFEGGNGSFNISNHSWGPPRSF